MQRPLTRHDLPPLRTPLRTSTASNANIAATSETSTTKPSHRTPMRRGSSALPQQSPQCCPSPLSPSLITPRPGDKMQRGTDRIRVCTRIRNFTAQELADAGGDVDEDILGVQVVDSTCVVRGGKQHHATGETPSKGPTGLPFSPRNGRRTSSNATATKMYSFDECFWSASVAPTSNTSWPPYASQQVLFESVGRPLVENAMKGYNSSFLVYGQTGSGKTYTVYGPEGSLLEDGCGEEGVGLIPRVCKSVFEDYCHAHDPVSTTNHATSPTTIIQQAAVTLCEVYQEKVYNLLSSQRVPLVVGGETTSVGFFVKELVPTRVTSYADVVDLLQEAEKHKSFGSTAMNARSSRAHTIFTMELITSPVDDPTSKRKSKIVLADLAGCENVKTAKSDASNKLLGEACSINASLTELRKCIEKAGKAKPGATIPEFRNSNLTKLLYDSVCGNSKCTILATASPHIKDITTTIQALKFADAAKSIKKHSEATQLLTDPVARLRVEHKKELESLAAELQEANTKLSASEAEVRKLKEENAALKQALEAAAVAAATAPRRCHDSSSGSSRQRDQQTRADIQQAPQPTTTDDTASVEVIMSEHNDDETQHLESPSALKLLKKGVDLLCSTAKRMGGYGATGCGEENDATMSQLEDITVSPITQLPPHPSHFGAVKRQLQLDAPPLRQESSCMPLNSSQTTQPDDLPPFVTDPSRVRELADRGHCVSCEEKVVAQTKCRRCQNPVHIKNKQCAFHKVCNRCQYEKRHGPLRDNGDGLWVGEKRKRGMSSTRNSSTSRCGSTYAVKKIEVVDLCSPNPQGGNGPTEDDGAVYIVAKRKRKGTTTSSSSKRKHPVDEDEKEASLIWDIEKAIAEVRRREADTDPLRHEAFQGFQRLQSLRDELEKEARSKKQQQSKSKGRKLRLRSSNEEGGSPSSSEEQCSFDPLLLEEGL